MTTKAHLLILLFYGFLLFGCRTIVNNPDTECPNPIRIDQIVQFENSFCNSMRCTNLATNERMVIYSYQDTTYFDKVESLEAGLVYNIELTRLTKVKVGDLTFQILDFNGFLIEGEYLIPQGFKCYGAKQIHGVSIEKGHHCD